MANLFTTLTLTPTDLITSASVSTYAPEKTITVSGTFSTTIAVEASLDGSTWAPVLNVQPPSGQPVRQTFTFVAQSIRAQG